MGNLNVWKMIFLVLFMMIFIGFAISHLQTVREKSGFHVIQPGVDRSTK